MIKTLTVAITADPYFPVPPKIYGGIERIVAFLVEGLIHRGHRVTLWAASGSAVGCPTITYGSPPHNRPRDRLRELWQVASTLTPRARSFDIVHSFGRLAALLPLLPTRLPKVQSYQRAIAPRSVIWGNRLAGRSLVFTACSTSCRRAVSHIGQWETIHNGVRLADYMFMPGVDPEAPLMFLGRIERIKGPHTAIEVARRSGRRLVIAGNIVEEEWHRRYFEQEIAPDIDGDRIR
jgi:glycosyltransferase involved in cell wall biosynthesis